MLLDSGGLVAIDIDDGIFNGSIKPHVSGIINALNTYTELSLSVPKDKQMPTGVNLWVREKLPGRFCRNDHLKVDMYQFLIIRNIATFLAISTFFVRLVKL